MEPTAVALERLAAPDLSVRSHAIRSLAPELVHVVRERLAELARTDPHWSVRQAALETLLRFDWQEAARLPARERTAFRMALEVFLNDPDWHVRLEAARALLRLDLEEAARTILEALQEAPEDTPLSTNLPLRDHLVRLTAESLFTAKIFPQHSEGAAHFDAAWNTYVIFCRPYDSVLEILRPFYLLAVERIGVRRDDTRWPPEDPDKRLAEHLMVFYWRGKLLLDDPLLVRFWEKAPDAVRAHALAFVGRSLEQTEGDIPAEILERLKQLWEQRLATAKNAQQPSDFEKEMAAFGWWFVSDKFDVDWAIAQLSESLQLARTSTLTLMVLENLVRTVPTHPRQSVECLRMIAEADREGWTLYMSREHVWRILEVAIRDASAADEAKKVIHYLGSRGFLSFRDLLKRR